MKKQIWLVIILGIIIVVLAGVLLWLKPANNNPNPQPATNGIQVTSPKANEEISSPLVISGYINGGGWTAFEVQAGTVSLVDENNNVLGTAILGVIDENWMKQFNNFKGNLTFISGKAQGGKLVFKNENASGLPEKDKTFSLPVKIAKVETMQVLIFFNGYGPGNECENVIGVARTIPKTTAVARVALEQLLLGLTDQDGDTLSTSINSGVKIQSLTIENGTAKVDFNEQLGFQVGGSCRVSAIRAQITETLKQFPTVKNVIISINGRTEDILQP